MSNYYHLLNLMAMSLNKEFNPVILDLEQDIFTFQRGLYTRTKIREQQQFIDHQDSIEEIHYSRITSKLETQ